MKRISKKGSMYYPTASMKKEAWVSRKNIYKENPKNFWSRLAKTGLTWNSYWKKTHEWKPPYSRWFIDGTLNACYNCVDRHPKHKTAVIWVPESENESVRYVSYGELYEKVNKFSNILKKQGVKKGDRVIIYMPMIPEVYIAMLSCARIGAIHSVVFSAFSSESLKQRIDDSRAKLVVTADGYYRKGKTIDLEKKVEKAIKGKNVKRLVFQRLKTKKSAYAVDYEKAQPYCEPVKAKSQDPLFILYSSGTTGKPKGIIHDTGGYLTQAFWTSKWIFNLHDDDVFWCTADVGWITGHTYGCYGPLANGATVLMYEGAPNYPTIERWLQIIEKFKVTVFYTAPTAIRMLMECLGKISQDLSSLRILGTVGEIIDEKAWKWYFEAIGNKNCPVIDTYWQTETGGALISVLPGIGPFKPSWSGSSFPGVRHAVLNEQGKEVFGKEGYLVQKPPFTPGLLHGIWGNKQKYIEEYWSKFGKKYYYTSDSAVCKQGKFRIMGRVDDVMKVAGHRISSGELENHVDQCKPVDECAVVPVKHKVKGQLPVIFAVVGKSAEKSSTKKAIMDNIVKGIGPIAKPKNIYFVPELPKTRSGKIMRRVLRKLVNKEKDLGNLSTLLNPQSVEKIKKAIQ